jgi:hypothetical protein
VSRLRRAIWLNEALPKASPASPSDLSACKAVKHSGCKAINHADGGVGTGVGTGGGRAVAQWTGRLLPVAPTSSRPGTDSTPLTPPCWPRCVEPERERKVEAKERGAKRVVRGCAFGFLSCVAGWGIPARGHSFVSLYGGLALAIQRDRTRRERGRRGATLPRAKFSPEHRS